MPITLLKSPAPTAPTTGKAAIFVDSADGVPKYIDESGVVHLLGSGANGPAGPAGPAGNDGQIRFTGYGAPGTIVGANLLDTYMDLDTGNIYQLT